MGMMREEDCLPVCANLGAKLQGANLRRAKLKRTILRGVNLKNADLSHADLEDADFRGGLVLGDSPEESLGMEQSDLSECLMDFAREHKVGTIYVQDLNYFSVEDEKDQLCGFTKEHLIEVLDAADKKAQEYGIDTNIGNWRRNMDAFYNKTLPTEEYIENNTKCTFPWVSCFIDVHGNILPCPVFVWEKKSESLGNALETPFEEIWNGETYKKLRGEFKENIRRNPICKKCVPPNIFDMKLIFQKMLLRG